MTHAKKRWSYSTGERGRNRVRAFEHPDTGGMFLEFTEGGKRRRVALGHRHQDAAKAKAEELAMALRRAEAQPVLAPTLRTLFDIYEGEVTPEKGPSKQRHDHRAAQRFREFFGPNRKAPTLNRRDWDCFIRWRRRSGDERPGRVKGRPVRARVIEYDLKFLQAVLNWAVIAGLLDRNPLKGMPWPKELSPRRPILTDSEYRAMLAVSRMVHPMCELALILAHETGHRISAILKLRWSDVDFERQTVHWRPENDKIGFLHDTPLSETAVAALEHTRIEQRAIGDAWIFPAPRNPSLPCSRHLFRDWWEQMEELAELPHVAGRGWHSLRRKFATELKHAPLRDLSYLGGWKQPQTVVTCYQMPDEESQRAALALRGRLAPEGVVLPNRHSESTHPPSEERKTNPA
jgi:integrase